MQERLIMRFARSITLDLSYDVALPKVKEAFKAQGFGTLTEIDVQATLEERLGARIERYAILGTCNPNLAHRALEVTRTIGLLLPCNVVVRESGNGVIVQALDPMIIAEIAEIPELQPIANEAGERIQAALDALLGGE
jgi:uncharacterized protein (DUF302 family)